MKEKIKKIIISLLSHLGVCLVLVILSAIITLVWPKTLPYVSAWCICACLCVLSVWDSINFGLASRHVYAYLVAIALSVIDFIFGLLDWLFNWDLLIRPWRQIAIFESLLLGLFFFLFLLIIFAEEDEPSVARGWPDRSPATT